MVVVGICQGTLLEIVGLKLDEELRSKTPVSFELVFEEIVDNANAEPSITIEKTNAIINFLLSITDCIVTIILK
jgi:hypothetical protein